MTNAPLFTSDDLTTLATAVTYYGTSVPHGMPMTEGYVQQVAKLRSLQARLQQWLDQQKPKCPIAGCTDRAPHLHCVDEVEDLNPNVWTKLLDETDLTNEG